VTPLNARQKAKVYSLGSTEEPWPTRPKKMHLGNVCGRPQIPGPQTSSALQKLPRDFLDVPCTPDLLGSLDSALDRVHNALKAIEGTPRDRRTDAPEATLLLEMRLGDAILISGSSGSVFPEASGKGRWRWSCIELGSPTDTGVVHEAHDRDRSGAKKRHNAATHSADSLATSPSPTRWPGFFPRCPIKRRSVQIKHQCSSSHVAANYRPSDLGRLLMRCSLVSRIDLVTLLYYGHSSSALHPTNRIKAG